MTTSDATPARRAADLVAAQYTASRERYPDPECWIAWIDDPSLADALEAAVADGLIVRHSATTYVPADRDPERQAAIEHRDAVVNAAVERARTTQTRAAAWGAEQDADPIGGLINVPVWIVAALLDAAGAD